MIVNPFPWIKKADDSVIAGTINGTNLLYCRKLVQKLAFANCANGSPASRSRAPIQNWPTESLNILLLVWQFQ
jgi:hypothetical protein